MLKGYFKCIVFGSHTMFKKQTKAKVIDCELVWIFHVKFHIIPVLFLLGSSEWRDWGLCHNYYYVNSRTRLKLSIHKKREILTHIVSLPGGKSPYIRRRNEIQETQLGRNSSLTFENSAGLEYKSCAPYIVTYSVRIIFVCVIKPGFCPWTCCTRVLF